MRRLTVLALLLAACSGSVPQSTATFDLEEYEIYASASTLRAGPIEFDVENDGEFPHTFVVTAADGSVVGALDPIDPGIGGTLVLDLPPGTYQVSCRIVIQRPDGSIVDHYQEGMHAQVDVVG